MRKIKDIFKPKKHSAETIAVVDRSGNTLFQGTAESIPLSEESIVKLSVKYFHLILKEFVELDLLYVL